MGNSYGLTIHQQKVEWQAEFYVRLLYSRLLITLLLLFIYFPWIQPIVDCKYKNCLPLPVLKFLYIPTQHSSTTLCHSSTEMFHNCTSCFSDYPSISFFLKIPLFWISVGFIPPSLRSVNTFLSQWGWVFQVYCRVSILYSSRVNSFSFLCDHKKPTSSFSCNGIITFFSFSFNSGNFFPSHTIPGSLLGGR